MLSWVDTAASTVGRTLGRYTPALPSMFAPRKSLAGFLGAVAMGWIAATYFWTNARTPSWARSPHPALHERSFARPFELVPRVPLPNSTLGLKPLVAICAVVAAFAESIDVCVLALLLQC